MGQKIHPNGFRLGVIRDWDAKWFATGSTYSKNLVADQGIRSFLRKRLANAAVSRIELVRAGETLNVTIHTGRPGIVIGKKGEDIEDFGKKFSRLTTMCRSKWRSKKFESQSLMPTWFRRTSVSS